MYNNFFQVLVGRGCLKFEVFALDYGGPFDCKSVQYMTGGIIGGVLLFALVAVCYRRRKRIHTALGRARIPSIYRLMPKVNDSRFVTQFSRRCPPKFTNHANPY